MAARPAAAAVHRPAAAAVHTVRAAGAAGNMWLRRMVLLVVRDQERKTWQELLGQLPLTLRLVAAAAVPISRQLPQVALAVRRAQATFLVAPADRPVVVPAAAL